MRERSIYTGDSPLSLVVCLVRGGDTCPISGLHTPFEGVSGLMGIGLFLVMC